MSSDALAIKTADEGREPDNEQGLITPPEFVATAEWEPDLKPWPLLPSAALPGICGELIELATRNSEADPAAALATFLVR